MQHLIAVSSSSSSSAFSLSLHRIAAVMSATRPPFRGGRGRRNFSDHRTPGVISGDSHFHSVQTTNSTFAICNNNNNNNNNNDYRSVGYRYDTNNNNSNNNNNNNNGARGGGGGGGGGFKVQPQMQSYRPRSGPNFNRNQQPVPPRVRSRPADYRIWEFASQPPPPNSERFIVLSYNILADYLANSHRNLYYHIPRRFMDWNWRKGNILFELNLWSPDIMCFQEVDKFNELEEDLRHRGYSGIWKMRTGEPIDGCAIFWRASRFKLVYEECIEFNKLGMRDNVAQICVLELSRNHTDKTPSACTGGSKRVVICNIHVLYNPRRGEIKLGQVRVLLERAQSISKKWDDAPVVLCGDFNCTSKSALYNYISERKLDISELGRDNVSGQASAVIRSPPRQYGQARGESAGNIASPTMVQNNSAERKLNVSLENQNASESTSGNVASPTMVQNNIAERKLNVSLENQNASESTLDDLQRANSLCQPPSDEPLSDRLCNDLLKSSMTSEDLTGRTNHNAEDKSHKNGGSAVSVSTDNLKHEDQSGHPDRSTEFIKSAESADKLASETEQDLVFTSSVASNLEDSSSGLLSEERVLKSSLTTDHYSMNCSIDRLSSSTDVSKKELVDEHFRDNCSSNSCQSESSGSISSESAGVYRLGTKTQPVPTTVCEASDSNTSLTFKNDIDEKHVAPSLNEVEESIEDIENLGEEDAEKFISELHNDRDGLSNILGDIQDPSFTPESEALDVGKSSYDPSLWTPMEIATATGNVNNTVLEHSLNLRSTYTEVEDRSGTRDSNGEPLVTSYNSCFMGTVDYIWRSEGLRTVKVLAPISKDAMQPTGGFPSKKWGSDHIALASELTFTK